MFTQELLTTAEQILASCRKRRIKIAVAESCTGGLIAALLTEIAGASDVFERGFVPYSNEAKQTLLGVPELLIVKHGAVSREVAISMAEGALNKSKAALSISVTGIAGPSGGSPSKPVGQVHIASVMKGQGTLYHCHQFTGDRRAIRLSAVQEALSMLLEQL